MAKKDKFDRLLDLIQNGKTAAIRKAAAAQIGFLQKEFSYELSTILHKLFPLLLHHEFDCRRATATALENLIPNCRQERVLWNTNRAYMKLSQFNLQRCVSSGCFLTHNLTSHNVAADDYKDQVFNISPDSKVAELCEVSEQMISKLNSPNWHYRHGAVVCLLSTIQSSVSKEYLEDLAVRLLTLISLDRFKDFSNDVVKVPVVDPACHLLARCLMMDVSNAIPILEQFHNFRSENDDGDDDDETDEGWSLRFAFWVIVQHMLIISDDCLPPQWLEKALLDTIKNESVDDVIASAIDAILIIIKKLPNPKVVANIIYMDVFSGDSDDNDLKTSNTSSTKALEALILQCNQKDFIDDDILETLIEHCSYSQSSTREATYSLINTIMDRHGLDLFNGFDFLRFMIKIIDIIIKENSPTLFRNAISMISHINDLMKIKRVVFDSKYCVEVMDSIGGRIKELAKIIPIILELASIVEIDISGPEFLNCKTVGGIIFCIILCLNLDTQTPVFYGCNDAIFQKDPVCILQSLFNLDPKDVIKMIPRIAALYSRLSLFVSKYVGRMLRELKNDEVIQLLIQKNADFEEGILRKFGPDDTYKKILAENARPPDVQVAQTIAINAVYKAPDDLNSIYNVLQLFYLVKDKQALSVDTVNMIIEAMMKGSPVISSMLAYISDLYAKETPTAFLTKFIQQIENKSVLSKGPVEFIDLFLTDFDTTKLSLLSWASFFVKPALQNFASQNDDIRRMAAHSLAQIVRLLPLDNGRSDLLPSELSESKAKSMIYLAPLFDITKAQEYELIPPPCFTAVPGGKIRDYQREGINWLGFLYEYGLNGILADDMGLGKTFQSLCAISNAHTKEGRDGNNPFSLVVCPPSVINHWVIEIKNFFPHLRATAYIVKSDLSERHFNQLDGILVTSYNIIRSSIDIFKRRQFTYCVLDEGHVIKNKTNKTAEAVTQLVARHRLILSGTPIQNNVAELWALMDFLMPGFLGTRKVFQQTYEGAIKKMFKPEATEAETERGQSVLQALHCQVLPFIMRRLRSVVLEELPPRVIFDEVVQMTSKQREIYERIGSHEVLPDGTEVNEHTFTKMKKERDLCAHPCLVDPTVPHEIEYSAKLKELRKILLTQLGLGGGKDTMKNRALLFAQSSQTLDIVRDIVLKNMSGVTYDFFDGRVPEKERGAVLERFNRVDGPDLLLLTTQVGGLGLNLQVANNVVFLENSWSFTEDEQAMARAHRMGQKRTVTVFNIITAGTIESNIIAAQQRKRIMVGAIINDENAQANTDITMVQDVLNQEDTQNKGNQNSKMSMNDLAKTSENLATSADQYITNYTNDEQWKNKDRTNL